MTPAELLAQVEALLDAGRYNEALRLLASDRALYQRVTQGVIRALESDPHGIITDINGNVWRTSDLIRYVRAGHWFGPLFNLLRSEVELLRRQLGG